MEELAGLLSRERLLLELLLFKLVSLRQLLVAGEVRFLPWASEEVDRATARVREAEIRRGIAVEALAAEAGPAGATNGADVNLRYLSEHAPEPWRTIFAEHRRGFLDLIGDIEDALAANRRLAGAGGAAVTATLDRLTNSAPSGGHLAQAGAGAPAGPAARYGTQSGWLGGANEARFSRTL